jgi:hypothetical protein
VLKCTVMGCTVLSVHWQRSLVLSHTNGSHWRVRWPEGAHGGVPACISWIHGLHGCCVEGGCFHVCIHARRLDWSSWACESAACPISPACIFAWMLAVNGVACVSTCLLEEKGLFVSGVLCCTVGLCMRLQWVCAGRSSLLLVYRLLVQVAAASSHPQIRSRFVAGSSAAGLLLVPVQCRVPSRAVCEEGLHCRVLQSKGWARSYLWLSISCTALASHTVLMCGVALNVARKAGRFQGRMRLSRLRMKSLSSVVEGRDGREPMGLSSAPMADLEQVSVLFGEHAGLLRHIFCSGSQGFCIRLCPTGMPPSCLQACLQDDPPHLASVVARRLFNTSIRSVCVVAWRECMCKPFPTLPVWTYPSFACLLL